MLYFLEVYGSLVEIQADRKTRLPVIKNVSSYIESFNFFGVINRNGKAVSNNKRRASEGNHS